ncbi:SGNH hydrolase [Xylariomycetidae sp. FL0641]|nr:SGNH hydrolase [Xylariomycetidae sp. FL0641]
MMSTAAAKPALRILCLGDSLTAGFPAANPYAHRLRAALEEALPDLRDHGGVVCVVEGRPGDRVDVGGGGGFARRCRQAWKQTQEPFDWTIVLGGTNDLGFGTPVDQIIESLKQIWDIPLSKGGKVLALTIPETKHHQPNLIAKRDEINQAIKVYEKPGFYAFDLHAALPYHALPPAQRPVYWNMDGVHLTAAGYDAMGEHVAGALARIVRLAEAQDTALLSTATRSQRQAIDDLLRQEERGDPKLLSQGYVVVRRKDLD